MIFYEKTAKALYFIGVISIGIYVSRKSSNDSINDFFLGGRKFGWGFVGLSLFVSNIGSEHFIGFAGSGALNGIGSVTTINKGVQNNSEITEHDKTL